MATAIPFGWAVQNAAGTAVSGARIHFTVPGTSTLRTPFSDPGLTVPTSNPVEADAAGWFRVYLSSELSYDIVVKSADDSITYQERRVASNIAGAQPVDATLTAIAGLTVGAGDYIEATGVDTFRARKLQVATYAALTAIGASARFDDMVVYVASRATDGDGGEGYWRFDAASSATADGGTILAPDAGTGRWLRIFDGTWVDVAWYGAVGDVPRVRWGDITQAMMDAATDDSAAFEAARLSGYKIKAQAKSFKLNNYELLLRVENQWLDGSGEPEGFYLQDVRGGTILFFTGTGDKFRYTRRLAPETSTDPDDADISVMVNVQQENTRVSNIGICCYVDLSDASPSNLGADYDVGVLNGCRVNVSFSNVKVFGYNRHANILWDVTRGNATAQHLDKDDIPLPAGTVLNGADGGCLYRVFTRGGKKGLFVSGAINSPSGDYYDYRTDTVLSVQGGRGGVGSSDFHAIDCVFNSREHHSGYRAWDPLSPLNAANESIDDAAFCIGIDGRRGSASQGRIRRFRFTNCRIATLEAARVFFDRTYEVTFDGVQNEPAAWGGSVFTTGGADITATFSDQSTLNYGTTIGKVPSGTQDGTDQVVFLRSPVNPNASHFPAKPVTPSGITFYELGTFSDGSSTLPNLLLGGDLTINSANSVVNGFYRNPLGATLGIVSGAITVSRGYHRVDTEASAASDDLDTINGGVDGARLLLRPLSSSRTVVVKDATGNLSIAGDFSMDSAADMIELVYDASLSAWVEISRSDNAP